MRIAVHLGVLLGVSFSLALPLAGLGQAQLADQLHSDGTASNSLLSTTIRTATSNSVPGNPGVVTVLLPGGVPMEFVRIPPGSFLMGSTETDGSPWETCSFEQGDCDKPAHWVNIEYDFYMGKYEVTQAQWQAVMGSNPSFFANCGGDCPVEQVSWNDSQEFVARLNVLGLGEFRLPSESEWEYAVRAGTTTRFFFGDSDCQPNGPTPCQLDEYAWWGASSSGGSKKVGQKLPNAWGLYDVYGNVYEWVQDDYKFSYQGAPTDGSPYISPNPDGNKSIRGGFRAYTNASLFTSAFRGYHEADFRHGCCGLRLVMESESSASRNGSEQVILEWEPSQSLLVTGYSVHWGIARRNYTNSLDVGYQTRATITGLTRFRTYYLTVRAYDSSGEVSDYSNEVVYYADSTTGLENTLWRAYP